MSKRLIYISIIVVLVIGGIIGFYFVPTPPSDSIELQGNVDIRETQLAFRQSGRISKIWVDEGSVVKARDLLAEIDATPFSQALDKAKANSQQALAQYEKLLKGSRPQEIQQARAQLSQTKAIAIETQKNYTRLNSLYETGAVSQQALDQAKAANEQAHANLNYATQTLSLQTEGARTEDIKAARANLDAARANQAQLETMLADTKLYAPTDAIVASRLLELGSMVSPATPVMTLSIPRPTYIRTYVSQTQLPQIREGLPAYIKIDGQSQRILGHVGFISPRAEFTPKTVETKELRSQLVYRIRIVITNGSPLLRQGMPVSISIPLQTDKH